MTSADPLRLALIGWGSLARSTAAQLQAAPVELVAVAVRSTSEPCTDAPSTAIVIDDPSDLAATRPDVVAEAAGRDSVGEWGHAALAAGADFIVSSSSAFTDEGVLASLRETAERNGARVIIQAGALAGIEALAAARHMGIDTVEHQIIKPPLAWRGTRAESMCDLENLEDPCAFFTANASETASAFPKNANVAMTAALAGIGPAATKITLIADPTATRNRHELRAHGAFGDLEVIIANNPLPTNPKTSAMAALSLVRSIENRVSSIVI